jgi:ubiquinone/menaquinone biosynthesis C-methylase UbiE
VNDREGSDAMELCMRALAITALGLSLLLTSAPIAAQDFGDAGRDKFENVAGILAALELEKASRVADIGAGDGFYSVRIARALPPPGRVMAVDVTEGALKRLGERLTREGVTNVDVTLGAFDNPRLSDNTYDAALIYNAYHEMTEFNAMLKGIFSGLRPGGRLVIIEPIHDDMRTSSRSEQTAKHEISDDFAAKELEAAGFSIARQDPEFRPFAGSRGPGGWWLIVALKPAVRPL